MATDFDKKLVNGEVLGKVAQGVLSAAAAKDTAVEERLQGKINTVSASVTTLDGKVDTAVETLENADSQLQTAINNEKTRAEGEEAKLSKAIADETTRAEGEEGKLSNRILKLETDLEGLVGETVTNKLTDLTNSMKDAEDDIDDLQERMTAAAGKVTTLEGQMGTAQGDIAKLKTDLTEEVNRAKGVEGELDAAIKDEITRATAKEGLIDNEISGLKTANANQDVSIAKAQSAADKAQGEVDALETKVDTLDTRLTNALSKEVSDRETAVQGVQAAVTKEVQDRKDAITGVQNAMNTMKTDLQGEIANAIAGVGVSALKDRVDTIQPIVEKLNGGEEVEGSVANALKVAKAYTDEREEIIEKYADDAVLVEKERAEAAEKDLDDRLGLLELSIDATDSALAEEVERAKGQETAIRQELADAIGVKAAESVKATGLRKEIADAVAAEETRAKNVEQAIRGEVTAAIAQEVTDRNDAIKVEADRAKAEEADIRADFAAADATLGGRIDGVVSRLNVIEGDGAGSIKKAQADAEAKAQELVNGLANGQVATNKANIQTLMGGEEVEGSVDNKIKDAINKVNGDAVKLEKRVKANEDNLAIVMGADTVEGSIAKAQKDAQAYADQKITALVDSAPDAMNTLKELANAINSNKGVYDAYIEEHATAMAKQKTDLQAEIDADVKAEADRAKGEEAKIRGEFADADTALHTTISAEIDADVKAEADRAKGEEAKIRQELAEEKAALQKEIDDDVAAEALIRKNADDALAGRLNKLEGNGEGSVKAAVKEVADELAKQKDPAQEGTLAHQIAVEKTRAQNAERANADGLVDLRSDVVATFKALKLDFTTTPGHAQIVLKQDGSMGENLMPIGDAVEIPVMSDADVQALIGSLQ